MEDKQNILEQHLTSILGAEKLKRISGHLNQIVEENGLQQSPELFEDLYIYSAWMIFGRNPV